MTAEQQTSGASPTLHESLHEYIAARYIEDDPLLRDLLAAAAASGLPDIQVPPTLGKLLAMLVRISGARRILEIGTLAGYSAIWMARALPPRGSLISLELEPKHAEIARRFLAQAGLADRVEIRLGPALSSLENLAGAEPFDMLFIDANKDQYPEYLEWGLRLVRPGGLILADNVLRRGSVLGSQSDPVTRGIQEYNDRVAREPRLEAVILLTRDGLDGVSIARVRDGQDTAGAQYLYE
jgi:predicted O-methyltransferase YrrM